MATSFITFSHIRRQRSFTKTTFVPSCLNNFGVYFTLKNKLKRSLNRVHKHLSPLLCTIIGFALDWESHKSIGRDRGCLIELLGRAFSEPYSIQGIQPAGVVWGRDNKGFERKRGWVVCIESLGNVFCTCVMLKLSPWNRLACVSYSVANWPNIFFNSFVCIGQLHLVRETICKIKSVKQT